MKATSILYSAVCLAALFATTPAHAQPTSEEIIVTGRYGTVPESVKSLSLAVSYRDLDLSTPSGQAELKHRIGLTARFLCDKLGESDSSSGVVPSCRDAAVSDAMARAGTIEEHFAPRGTTWVAGPPWAAPYPPGWVTEYP
jgi:UrcA family protein